MPLNPRSKGKRGEYEVRDLLRGFGYKAERTPLSGAIDGWEGDITSDAPMFIEVKNTAKTHFLQWYKKANDECGGKAPVIAWTTNQEPVYAFLLFTDLLQFIKRAEAVNLAWKKPTKPKRDDGTVSKKLKFSKYKQANVGKEGW